MLTNTLNGLCEVAATFVIFFLVDRPWCKRNISTGTVKHVPINRQYLKNTLKNDIKLSLIICAKTYPLMIYEEVNYKQVPFMVWRVFF